MLFRSQIEARGAVAFPAFLAERVYMREFRKDDGLPSDLSRWQLTVDQMLDGIDTGQPMFLMIDQSVVPAGKAQRRPGLHIDGYWHPGGKHQQHRPNALSAHHPEPRHGSIPPPPRERHSPTPRHFSGTGDWSTARFDAPEAILLASDVTASRAFVGDFEGPIGDMGDCSHVHTDGMEEIVLGFGTTWAANVTCLHESLPVLSGSNRTLVRINVPGWHPQCN